MKNFRFVFPILVAALLVMVLASTGWAQSCPMCKESMTAAGAKLSKGFYYSIISMWSLPFMIGGGISSIIFKSWYEKRHPEEEFHFVKAVRKTMKKKE